MRSLEHRGPDACGVWEHADATSWTVLGSRRLRVLDVSSEADMPLVSEDQQQALVYNGEVYNYRELRELLSAAGFRFHTTSDTECVLNLYRHLQGDVPAMLEQLEGMFAFALWDSRFRRLVVARDRLGIKPLYFANESSAFWFSSEPLALVRAGVRAPRLDHDVVGDYLAWGHVPGGRAIVEGVNSLEPGHFATWQAGRLDVSRWWQPHFRPTPGRSDAELVAELGAELRAAVLRQTVADRPVGVFLSSGADSRAVATLSAAGQQMRALTLGFPDAPRLDESDAAAAAAEAIGLSHVVVPLTSGDAQTNIARALTSYAQPTVDALNSWFVSRAAADLGWVVALSGLGGDELFSGYGLWGTVPRVARIRGALGLAGQKVRTTSSAAVSARRLGTRLGRVLEAEPGVAGGYAAVRTMFSPSDIRRLTGSAYVLRATSPGDVAAPSDEIATHEMQGYMSARLLADTDAVSMAFSLETRVPLLDEKVVRFALSAPAGVRQRLGKRMLASAAGVPELVKKQGFELPMTEWLLGSLRGWARESLLSPDLPLNGLLSADARKSLWTQFESGRVHWTRPWSLIVLRRWADHAGLDA